MVNKSRTITLGISAFYHDSAAALIIDGRIVCAAQEERFTRIKHDPAFPENAVRFCLEYASITAQDVTNVVFYEKPLLKFERIIETFLSVAPKGLKAFLVGVPSWTKEKMFPRKMLSKHLDALGFDLKDKTELLFIDHHLSHAASAFYPSPFEDAAIVTIDGVGEKATASIGHGKGARIEMIKEMRFPNSIGLLYSAFTYYLGFRVNSGEYKLMGLAPYGNPQSEKVEIYRKKITSEMIVIHEDGSVELNQTYFNYMSGLTMTSDKVWEEAFGFPRKKDEEEIMQYHCDLALAIQKVTDEIVTKMVAYALQITQSKNVCLAGGVALNCVSNSHMSKALGIDSVWIQPAAGDAGGALGAALAVQYMYSDIERKVESTDSMQGSYLGPDFEQFDVDMVVKKYKAKKISFDTDDMLCREVAGLIAEGNVVGWVQGRMEWGPRALGNRSILANPMDPSIQKRLNLKIKCREGFRPFAPAILAEEVSHYFETKQSSPYMLFVHDVVKTLRSELPEDYHTWSWQDRLYFERSSLPAVTHLDYSARLQTVHKETNPLFHKLITEFKNKTQCPVIVNTSFNVRGEPIVSTPDDSYRCFMTTDMDCVVIGRNIFFKKDQSVYTGKSAFAKD